MLQPPYTYGIKGVVAAALRAAFHRRVLHRALAPKHMLIEIQSSEEFHELLFQLRCEHRAIFTLWHPRKSDRWLWKLDVEEPKTQKIGQGELGL